MTYIRHITLATCHARDSYRSEVDDSVIASLQDIIAQMEAKGRTGDTMPIPGPPGYSLSGQIGGRCMVVSVWADGPPSELLLSIGIAAHERCGAAVWRTLHQVGLPAGSLLPPPNLRSAGEYRMTDPDHQPRAPWCAAAMEMAIIDHPDAMQWMGDFERCLAWAWLDYVAAVGRH